MLPSIGRPFDSIWRDGRRDAPLAPPADRPRPAEAIVCVSAVVVRFAFEDSARATGSGTSHRSIAALGQARLVIELVRSPAGRALDVALPAECVGCGGEGPPLCAACVPALDRRLEAPAGAPIGLPGDLPAPLLQLDWCAPFSGTVRAALHAIKYGGEQRLAEPLGAAVARRWARIGVGADLVTHVPVHAARARTRGYDQAELVARVAAATSGCRMRHCSLASGRRSPNSTSTDPTGRPTSPVPSWPARRAGSTSSDGGSSSSTTS